MRPIKDCWLIQIEITNACTHRCLNCTRLVGHHRKTYFMDLAMIEKAIDSLEGFPGGIGIMGGEPTLHPRFREICLLMLKKVAPEKRYLWTSGYRWKDYRSLICRTFAEHIYYNDHTQDDQAHQPILLAIDDVLEDKAYMKELINKCWIQEIWSPSINPKGGFFCEVAAAMDLLFDGPGGYPLEKGWWNRSVQEYQDQVNRYCLRCGAALPLPRISNKEGNDTASLSNYQKLQDLRSPEFIKQGVTLLDVRFTKEQIKEFAKTWTPWKYLGAGKRKSYYALYGPIRGFLVHMGKKIRKSRAKKIARQLLKKP